VTHVNKDIGHLLNEWEYDPERFSVRRIRGKDGKVRIQVRLDLGILQMETSGRPDGRRIRGKESLLRHYRDLARQFRRKHGSDDGFQLDDDDCAALRQEAIQYYHRYMSFLELEDYKGVIEDTEHNLDILALIKRFARDDEQKLVYEQFRPYILMIQTRARASIPLHEKEYDEALQVIGSGVAKIKRTLKEMGVENPAKISSEVQFLQEWAEQIRGQKPESDLVRLKRELKMAVSNEEYETAASLRDRIDSLPRR